MILVLSSSRSSDNVFVFTHLQLVYLCISSPYPVSLYLLELFSRDSLYRVSRTSPMEQILFVSFAFLSLLVVVGVLLRSSFIAFLLQTKKIQFLLHFASNKNLSLWLCCNINEWHNELFADHVSEVSKIIQ